MERRQFFTHLTGAGVALGAVARPAPAADAEVPTAPLPAATLDDLDRAVRGVLSSKRVGQPVFVRLTLHGPAPARTVVPRLARLVTLAARWVGQALTRLHATGSPRSGQVCLTLQFAGGASALVRLARGPVRGDGVDLMVLGSRGAVYHDEGTGHAWDGGTDSGKGRADPKLAGLIERALRSGRPEAPGAK
jgi:hypothetical protein